MEKQIEENRRKVIDYLEKTSLHVFVLGGDSESPKYLKVIKDEDNFLLLNGSKIKPIGVDWFLNYYKSNTKCVIKHMIFLNKGAKSIRNNKYVKNEINKILESQKN